MPVVEFVGRLHPLIVHLPIGILLFAFVMQCWQLWRKVNLEIAISFALATGTLSAGLACLAGWILAQSGEYAEEIVLPHQYLGIGSAVLGGLAYLLKRWRTLLLSITVIVLSIAGHYGGNLTHGSDYLFPSKDATATLKVPDLDSLQNLLTAASPDTAHATQTSAPRTVERRSFLYRDAVVPILSNRCYSCHGPSKMKGGLRLDSEAFIKKGGKNGPVLIPGNPEGSNLFNCLLLPEEDKLHMPPQGKPQLTKAELAALHFWIKRGASFQEQIETIQLGAQTSGLALAIPALPEFIINSKKDSSASAQMTSKNPVAAPLLEAQILATPVAPAASTLIKQLKAKNLILSQFGENSSYLMANFVNVKTYDPSLLEALQAIAPQLLRLRLSNLPVQDEDLKKLSPCKNLTWLNLEKTAISDAALPHLSMFPNLEQLNLYGTNVSDAGLLALSKCPSLKSIYLWQTKVTPSGVEKLKKALPHVQIELGGFHFSKPDSSNISKKQTL